jgi:hypothetical protein
MVGVWNIQLGFNLTVITNEPLEPEVTYQILYHDAL